LLQRQRVLAHDAYDFPLLGRQFAADSVAQQLGAFAHRGQRRLELVRDVPQKTILLLLELVQTRAQPFEALPQIAHVLRAVDLDRMREVGASHLADCLVQLPYRPCDQYGEVDGQQHGDQSGGERQVTPGLASFRRRLLQPLDFVLGQPVGGADHRLRVLGQRRVAVGKRFRRTRRTLRRLQQRKEPGFVFGNFLELRDLPAIERKLHQLLRRLPEILTQAPVIVDQLSIVEDQLLAHQAFERRRLLIELTAGTAGLRCLQYCLLTLRPQSVEADDQFEQRMEQGQTYKQEAEQNEFEE